VRFCLPLQTWTVRAVAPGLRRVHQPATICKSMIAKYAAQRFQVARLIEAHAERLENLEQPWAGSIS